ncbi:hypothetical protein REH81_01600 [Vibrio rotiferianus]
MATYAQGYQKLMSSKKDQVEAAFKKAKEFAMSHKLQHVVDEDGYPFPLVEQLTLEGQPGSNGEEEIELLLDGMIIEALMAFEGLLPEEDKQQGNP